tara:strand:+ start:389 stop:568 length:180 start_codon:yes stop_codon:yes gene_type:complete
MVVERIIFTMLSKIKCPHCGEKINPASLLAKEQHRHSPRPRSYYRAMGKKSAQIKKRAA